MAPPPAIGLAGDLRRHRADRVPIRERVGFIIGNRLRSGPLVSQQTPRSEHRLIPNLQKLPPGLLVCELIHDGKKPPPRRIQAGDLPVCEKLALTTWREHPGFTSKTTSQRGIHA